MPIRKQALRSTIENKNNVFPFGWRQGSILTNVPAAPAMHSNACAAHTKAVFARMTRSKMLFCCGPFCHLRRARSRPFHTHLRLGRAPRDRFLVKRFEQARLCFLFEAGSH